MARLPVTYKKLIRSNTKLKRKNELLHKQILTLKDKLKYPPDRLLNKWLKNELKDLHMLIEHCTKIYSWATTGRVTKPNTLPEVVIEIAEELRKEECCPCVHR
jgi:hypothetical protein